MENSGIGFQLLQSAPTMTGYNGVTRRPSARRSPHGVGAANAGCAIAPAEADLGTDVAGEAASGGYDAGFDLDFLGFAVHLLNEAVNLGSTAGMSLTMTALVRSSATMSPR